MIVNGKIILNMKKEDIILKMEKFMKVNGKMIKFW